jgi:hypothetical protein
MRTFDIDHPDAAGRLVDAWDTLQRTLDDCPTAYQLDNDDLDHIIAELVGLRHQRLTGVGAADSLRTIVTQTDGRMTLASYASDEFGNEFGPLDVEDRR